MPCGLIYLADLLAGPAESHLNPICVVSEISASSRSAPRVNWRVSAHQNAFRKVNARVKAISSDFLCAF